MREKRERRRERERREKREGERERERERERESIVIDIGKQNKLARVCSKRGNNQINKCVKKFQNTIIMSLTISNKIL